MKWRLNLWVCIRKRHVLTSKYSCYVYVGQLVMLAPDRIAQPIKHQSIQSIDLSVNLTCFILQHEHERQVLCVLNREIFSPYVCCILFFPLKRAFFT